ncbi:7-methylguanosine phosphate-specific 5'-nucleotidase [Rhagoletis pomonella]|uniref:7-methylguanosine phosphate-specific 5'-nucleotidase n=1 Tax=Rhagoletis pomonella TaxID=28610 RepID=UPI001781CD8F|nr:7-methylguanosine phosphate-specific 5'-nucleotidase [Rhagoletis pomonella]
MSDVQVFPDNNSVALPHIKPLRLEDIPILNNENCKIKDRQRVEKTLNEFVAGGHERLQVVSDFDYTITKQRTANGTSVPSSFNIFEECKSLPVNFVKEARELHDTYRPIEVDPHIPLEEKAQAMIEWWTKSGKNLMGFAFDLNEIDEITKKYAHSVRNNTQELFWYLNELNIPVLVFSAGLGNCVIAMLRQAGILYPNVKVISNFLQFKDGMLNGFQEPIIHTFNKNETMLEGSDYYDLVHNRDHILLMGDTLADSGMADGVPASSHVIKIGFLFHHVQENMEQYMNTFDIVLVDDQTMDVPLTLLKLIKGDPLSCD